MINWADLEIGHWYSKKDLERVLIVLFRPGFDLDFNLYRLGLEFDLYVFGPTLDLDLSRLDCLDLD